MAKKSNIIDQNKPTPVSAIRLNRGENGLPRNPRLIKDARFRALCKSVETDPQIMNARPIIVDENGTILGGNMRYRACLELGMKELPAGWVQQHAGWTLEQKRRFILKDNNSYGEFDWQALADEWAAEQTRKQCYAMELDPGYVAVALQRYLDATGVRMELEGKK